MGDKIKIEEEMKKLDEKMIQVGEWVYGGIAFDEDRKWIDTPFIGQVLVDKNTIRTIYRIKR